MMKKLGLFSFFAGILIIVFYSLSQMFQASDVAFWIKAAITLVIAGVILVLVNQFLDRKKEKEEENDSRKY